jgi:hypothetical protein
MKSHKEITRYTNSVSGFGTWKIEKIKAAQQWHLSVRLEQGDPANPNPSHQLMPYLTAEEAGYGAAGKWSELPSWNQFRPQSKEDFHLSKWKPHEDRVADAL